MPNEIAVTKQLRKDKAYYSVVWSPVLRARRHEIVSKVPSVPGIFELFVLDGGRTLNPVRTGPAWYGGLRSTLRAITDATTCRDPRIRTYLKQHTLYYRYTACDSYQDMVDVLSCIAVVRPRVVADPEHSGRYAELYLNERAVGGMINIG